MTTPVALGLIGCGRIAQVAHLPAIEKVDGVRLVAVADRSPLLARASAERYRVGRHSTSPERVIADPEVEAVLLAVPDRLHHALAACALRAGKHVLVEKPLATGVEECRALADLVASTGLVLQVGAMKRHDPGMRFARRWIGERVGRVLSFTAWYRVSTLRPAMEAALFPPVVVDPEVREAEAGHKADRPRYLLATHGAHLFDGLRFLLGDVARLGVRSAGMGTDHCWHGVATTRAGALGSFDLTVDAHGGWSEGFFVTGEGGSVRVDSRFPYFRQASRVHAFSDADQAWTTPAFGAASAYERQLAAFAAAVRGGAPPDPGVEDGLAAVRLIEAARASVELGREIEL